MSPAASSSNAFVFHVGEVAWSIDLHCLTRRCVIDDTATPEMYRECFYDDYALHGRLPVMSVFPPGRDPLPDDQHLCPYVLPATFPSPVPVSSMDDCSVVQHAPPLSITRVSEEIRSMLSESGHSSNTHVAREIFGAPSGPDSSVEICVFDFGYDTFIVLCKISRTFEEARALYSRLGSHPFFLHRLSSLHLLLLICLTFLIVLLPSL